MCWVIHVYHVVHTVYRICKVLDYINIDYALCHANTDVSYLLAFQYKAPFLRLKTHLFHSCYGKTSYIQYSRVYLLTENCSFEHEIGHGVSASSPEQNPQRCEVYREVRLLIDVELSCGLLPPANEVWGKVIFLHLFVILFTGGVWYPSMHLGHTI